MKSCYIKISNPDINLQISIADNFFLRLRGLLGYKEAFPLLFSPCNQIHTLGMKFTIDVIYFDKNFNILCVTENLSQNKIVHKVKNGYYVLELPAGFIRENRINSNSSFMLYFNK